MFKGGSLKRELYRTAEMLVDISEKQGIYFAIAFLYDSNYDIDQIKTLLSILKNTKNSIKTHTKQVSV